MITHPIPRRYGDERRIRHVSLGRRLEVLQLIHAGRISPEEAAALMGVSIREVHRWQSLHAGERIVSTSRPNGPAATHEELDLLARRGRLVRLLRSVEGNLRELHARLLARTGGTRSTMA